MPSGFEIDVSGTPDQFGVRTAYYRLNLAEYEFTALGDYKFAIREIGSGDAINYPIDDEKNYYFYVSVRNRLDDTGKPTGEYVATLAEQVKNHDTGNKTDAVFESSAQRGRIEVTNTVSGNLANVNDYFKYKIVIDNAHDGDTFTVYGQDDSIRYNSDVLAPTTRFTIDDEDDYIYLKHGQTVYIGYDGSKNELPIGLRYSLIEVDSKGYIQYVDNMAGNSSQTKIVSVDDDAASNRVDFLNHKEGNVLTGVVINVLPYALIVGVVGLLLGIVYVNKKKQRKTKCSK